MTAGRRPGPRQVALGLRPNLGQFVLLVAVNALVGGMVGQERTVLPLLADSTFGISAFTLTSTFVVAFGATKAATNLLTGVLADRIGRKPVLVAGWLVGVPVPLLLMWAPSWGWIVVANVLLGVNQGATWSATVIMKVDLAGPERRGFALGLNEAAGYGAVALTALATGELAARHGLRPAPFLLGLAFAGLGLGLSALVVEETREHARLEGTMSTLGPSPAFGWVFATTTWRDRSLAAVCQAGLVNNAVDGLAWAILPLLFVAEGLSVGEVGVLSAVYPGVWCVGQLFTGAWSDVVGRRALVVPGMALQALALAGIAMADGFAVWVLGAALLGFGTALVYPTLLAAVGDVAHPSWRAGAIGVYRLWRDSGYVVGAFVAGAVADLVDVRAAVWVLAGLSLAAGAVAAAWMQGGAPERSSAAGGLDRAASR